MTIQEITNYLDYRFNICLAQNWDNSGLQTKVYENNLKGVHFCLDINEKEIQKAICKNANLIVSHHPIYIKSSQLDSEYVKKIFSLLEKNLITAYSAHTNLDSQHDGLNFHIVKKLNWNIVENIESNTGVICNVEKTSLEQISSLLKQTFDVDFQVYKNNDKPILKVGFCSGSAGELYDICYKKGVDVFISGDFNYHIKQEAQDLGFNLINIDHSIEKYVVEIFEDIFKQDLNLVV